MINPTTHAISDFTLPPGQFQSHRNHGGSRRQHLVHRAGANEVGMINPTTHAISEFATPRNQSRGHHGGPRRQHLVHRGEGSQIGMINPTTHAITEFPVRSPNAPGMGSRPVPTATSGSPVRRQRGREINPTTDAITEFPSPPRVLSSAGSRRAPTATSGSPSRPARSGPSTRRPTPSPSTPILPGFDPTWMHGPDGNLWFTDAGTNAIGVAILNRRNWW